MEIGSGLDGLVKDLCGLSFFVIDVVWLACKHLLARQLFFQVLVKTEQSVQSETKQIP